jgi:hypothetical protein
MTRAEQTTLRDHVAFDDNDQAVAILQGTAALGATTYQVKIAMDLETSNFLYNGKYSLYAFKAVATAVAGGKPTVWFQTMKYSTKTNIAWMVQYEAYTSSSEIRSGVTIDASFTVPINLGQLLSVNNGTGTGVVTNAGSPGTVSIYNATNTDFTCGISQQTNGAESQPMCAFPLIGTEKDVIAPIEKVLLMFATKTVNTGTVIEKAYGPGVLIDLTGAPANTREVSYKKSNGWDWGGYAWASSTLPDQDLVPLLIDDSALRMAASLLGA